MLCHSGCVLCDNYGRISMCRQTAMGQFSALSIGLEICLVVLVGTLSAQLSTPHFGMYHMSWCVYQMHRINGFGTNIIFCLEALGVVWL